MSFLIRPARPSDLQALYEMAKLTGGGFTNLPANRPALESKLEASAQAFANSNDELTDERFVMVLEHKETGAIRGTCQLFTKVGQVWPFYSYRLSTWTQHSEELNKTIRTEILSLVTDLEGCSEAGGLFLHPNERAGGLGLLLARSRYLFIAMHRNRFANQTLAELRGVIDDAGESAFWDSVGGKFFDMSFAEADMFNALNGNQFIADLMPKHPIYVDMLDEAARKVIGRPNVSGRAAMRMLENEGFSYEGYVDIFDGGPSMIAKTDRISSIANAASLPIRITDMSEHRDSIKALVATGHLSEFRCAYGRVIAAEEHLDIDKEAAATLNITDGDHVTYVAR
ncbi:arginine N-succinyltransferase [Parasphingorhabdus sp. DH2-15]|uniref:arginine N-succinyltransferase n=1 Tax=Parasphingorhabdus sp. DH2-15 TaxID=3444112 RepID=UPI003F684064